MASVTTNAAFVPGLSHAMPAQSTGKTDHAYEFLKRVECAGAERRARAAVVIQDAAIRRLYRPSGRFAARDRIETLQLLNMYTDEVEDEPEVPNADAAVDVRRLAEAQQEIIERTRNIGYRPISFMNRAHLRSLCADGHLSTSLKREIGQYMDAFK